MPPQKRPRPNPIAILRGHTHFLTAVTFLTLPDTTSRYLLTGDSSGTLRLWDITASETVLSIPLPSTIPSTPIQSIAQDPTETSPTVLLHYKAGQIYRLYLSHDPFVVDLTAWRVAQTTPYFVSPPLPTAATDASLCESFCPVVYLAPRIWAGPAGHHGEAVVVRDDRAGDNVVGALPALIGDSSKAKHAGMLMSLSPLPTSTAEQPKVLAGYEDGSVATWDARYPTAPVSRVKVAKDVVTSVVPSPLGRVAVAGGGFDRVVGVADTEGEDGLRVVKEGRLQRFGIAGLAWRPDGRIFVSAGWDGRVRVWDGRRTRDRLLRRVASLNWHDDGVGCVCFSKDGKLFASGGRDRTVAVWNGSL